MELGPVDRRTALRTLGVGGALVASPALLNGTANAAADSAARSPLLLGSKTGLGAPPIDGIHLTFGADPTSQMVVSWTTATDVSRPRVRYGTVEGGLGREVPAETTTYIDGASSREVYAHHARLNGLRPDETYIYSVLHDGVLPEGSAFRTAPRGRAPFTFTSFGDQSVPDSTWLVNGSAFSPELNGIASPAAGDIVDGIEQVAPLFHLLNGDLCYANITPDRVRTWNQFFANNTRSARRRPWMPAAGNHENELGNGAIGYSSFQTRFALPGNGEQSELEGLWYAFTVGGVRVVVLQNDDVALQDAGGSYVSGYSGGAQKVWLEKELRRARASRDIDWIVVCMHQVIVSSSNANGADLGIRQQWGPLFDQYEVDLVLCGHEHDYERSLPVRGTVSGSATLTPNPVASDTSVIDTSQGTVHMVLGGGGNSSTSNGAFFTNGQAKVITGIGAVVNGKHQSVYTYEEAVWMGVRDPEHPYGFAAFDVDPGTGPGATTRMYVTYYNVNQPDGSLSVLETFTLQRKRADG